MQKLYDILWGVVIVLVLAMTIVTASRLYFGAEAFGGTEQAIEQTAKDYSAWDIWDVFLPDTIKNLPPSTLLTVGVLFAQALGWNLTKSNIAKWEMENQPPCDPDTDPYCTAGGLVSKRGTTYPVAPLLGTHPTQASVDTYYICLISGELLTMIFMPEIMKGINGIGKLFTDKQLISLDEKNVETWRIAFGSTLLAWEAGSCLYAVSVKKQF